MAHAPAHPTRPQEGHITSGSTHPTPFRWGRLLHTPVWPRFKTRNSYSRPPVADQGRAAYPTSPFFPPDKGARPSAMRIRARTCAVWDVAVTMAKRASWHGRVVQKAYIYMYIVLLSTCSVRMLNMRTYLALLTVVICAGLFGSAAYAQQVPAPTITSHTSHETITSNTFTVSGTSAPGLIIVSDPSLTTVLGSAAVAPPGGSWSVEVELPNGGTFRHPHP